MYTLWRDAVFLFTHLHSFNQPVPPPSTHFPFSLSDVGQSQGGNSSFIRMLWNLRHRKPRLEWQLLRWALTMAEIVSPIALIRSGLENVWGFIAGQMVSNISSLLFCSRWWKQAQVIYSLNNVHRESILTSKHHWWHSIRMVSQQILPQSDSLIWIFKHTIV